MRHFGFTPIRDTSDSRGDTFAVLRGEDGFILNIMRKSEPDAGAFPAQFHVGFLLDTPALVHEAHARLAADGIDVGDDGTIDASRLCIRDVLLLGAESLQIGIGD